MAEIRLSRNKGIAIIDDEDYDRVNQYRWRRHNAGYATTYIHVNGVRKQMLMHRFILEAPDGSYVDHKDGNSLNNTRTNIRIGTQTQNMGNTRARGGTSPYKGVHWHSIGKKWCAKIGYKGHYYYLGLHTNEIDAARAYNVKAVELFGEFARLNVINEEVTQ